MVHRKHFWIWLVVTIVLIILALGLAFWKVKVAQKAVPASTVVGNVPAGQLPANFPAGVPIEAGALVTSNFNAATQSGQFQATRSFQSSKTAAQNIDLYAKFLANPANGWMVISSSTDASGGAIMVAKNSGGALTIQVRQLPPQPMPVSSVEITYTTNPPRP